MAGYLIGGRLVAGGGLDAGEITVRAVPASSSSFELPLNRDGSLDISVDIPLVDPLTGTTIDLPNLLVPGRDFLGWVEKHGDVETIIEAGPIWGDPFDFPYTSRIVAAGLWSYFDHRFVLPVLAPGKLPRDVTTKLSGLRLGTIAKHLVQQACSHPNSALPIDYEADREGTDEREYPGSDMVYVGDALDDLARVEGGPDITFRPKWGQDRRHVRWDLLTGDPELRQAGHDHYWDVSVPDPHATIISLDRDAKELTTRSFQTGSSVRNLKRNPSFEDDLDGYAVGGNAKDGAISQGAPFHGAKVASWRSVAAGNAFLDSRQTFDVEPGEHVLCAAYMRAASTIPLLVVIRFKREDGSIITDVVGDSIVAAAGGVSWVRPFVSTTAPAAASSYEIYLAGTASAANQLIMADAITVAKTDELVPFSEDDVELQAVAQNDALTAAGFPLLESHEARSSVQRSDILSGFADETVARGADHIQTFSLVTRRDKAPFFGSYWPGDHARIRIGDNPRIPAGTYRIRITGISFSSSGDVSISCAPERVASGYPVPSSPRRWFRDEMRAMRASINESRRG